MLPPDYSDRPQIKVPLNWIDWILIFLGILSVAILVFTWIKTWPSVPNEVPPDYPYQLKNPRELLIMPILALKCYLIIMAVAAVPADYNYAWKITTANAAFSYRLGRRIVFAAAAIIPWLPFAFYLRSVRHLAQMAS